MYQAEKGQGGAPPGREHSKFKDKASKSVDGLGSCEQLREAGAGRTAVGIKLEGRREALYYGHLALWQNKGSYNLPFTFDIAVHLFCF